MAFCRDVTASRDQSAQNHLSRWNQGGGAKRGDLGASGEGQGWGRGEDLVTSGKGPTKEGGGTLGPLGINAEAS